MEIRSRTTGSFHKDPFSIFYSMANKYKPLYARDSWDIDRELPQGKGGYYCLPSFHKTHTIRSNPTIKRILQMLEHSLTACRFEINGEVYFILKGVIFNALKQPLLVMGQNIVEEEKYVLFYSTTFLTNPKLAAFNRRLQKTVLLSCFTKGIEVRLVDPITIEKNTFARILEKPFDSISELTHHLRQTLPLFLKPEGEDTLDFKEVTVRVEENEVFPVLTIEEEARLLGFILEEDNIDAEEARGQRVSTMEMLENGEYIVGIDSYQEDAQPVAFRRGQESQHFERGGEYVEGVPDSFGSSLNLDSLREQAGQLVEAPESSLYIPTQAGTPINTGSTIPTIILIDDVD